MTAGPTRMVVTPTRRAAPSFRRWTDWAKYHFIAGHMTYEEFDAYVTRQIQEGDPCWSPLPGGVHAGPLLITGSDGVVRDFTFEHRIDGVI